MAAWLQQATKQKISQSLPSQPRLEFLKKYSSLSVTLIKVSALEMKLGQRKKAAWGFLSLSINW